MDDVIQIEDRYYIAANSSLADFSSEVLKRGDTFLVSDHHGNVRPLGVEDHGLFNEGTRFLSRYGLAIHGRHPVLLSSGVTEDNRAITVDMTNPDFTDPDGRFVRKGSLHLHRLISLDLNAFHDRVQITNFSSNPIRLQLAFEYEADFADIFEVRGMQRQRRGHMLEPVIGPSYVVLGYNGLDERPRSARVDLAPVPDELTASTSSFEVLLRPHEAATVSLSISCLQGDAEPTQRRVEGALHGARETDATRRTLSCRVETSNEQFNDWLDQSMADTIMMLTDTPQGLYPYAGIPWFSTPFGRDGIITALETLWVNPDIARGVLAFLAAHQADAVIPEQEAEPGKIVHELRKGEMANLGEIPFGCYYGTADATPLFLVLAGRWFESIGDLTFIGGLWPNIERALAWIDEYGDVDGDGFVEYAMHTTTGLINQGWKDSHDSVFHADGSDAVGPIALCEVQAYVYEAKRSAATIADALGKSEHSARLRAEAEDLRQRFEQHFWRDELGTYALALDGKKAPCLVRSSNAGHCLFGGIAGSERASVLVSTLLADESFSGWGIRTVPTGEARYNPMSYHNGSVWPHDTAMIAAGMARYGFREEALRVLSGMFAASRFIHMHRLPELFCGFPRRPREGPTLYPVACAPQAWAAAVPFLLLQSTLGLRIDGIAGEVHLDRPLLPEFLQSVTIRGLRVGAASVDLAIKRGDPDVTVNVIDRKGDVRIAVLK